MEFYKRTFLILISSILMFFAGTTASAQQNMEEIKMQQKEAAIKQAKEQMREYLDKEIDRLTRSLDLEYWQVFYADSAMTHDMTKMQEELFKLQGAKVGNVDMYTICRDKWMESTYQAFNKFLTPKQWKKYLKMGAGREKKGREKRKAKREKKINN